MASSRAVAAWLVKHLAARVLGVAAGGLIVITNVKTLIEAVGGAPATVWSVLAFLAVLWITGIVWAVRQERVAREVARLEESYAAS